VDRAWLRSLVHTSCGPCRSDPKEGQVSFLGAASLTCLLSQSSIITDLLCHWFLGGIVLCKRRSNLLLWYVLEKTAVTELKMPSAGTVTASAVIGILPSPSLEFLPMPSLEFLTVPSVEFCQCRRWNFAVAVVGIFAIAVIGIFANAVIGIFNSAVSGILPVPLLEFCRRRWNFCHRCHWNF
jgi:hypothetical protein